MSRNDKAASMVSPGAIAIFVKTSGISPLKTRLAQTVGRDKANWFYDLSVRATQAVVMKAVLSAGANNTRTTRLFTAYWAVAEESAISHPTWTAFDRISQGGGDLGQRLFRVYSELLTKHKFVILVGADSPLLTAELLHQASLTLNVPADLQAHQFSIGPAEDGGFYLFGGNGPIPEEVWSIIPYGQSNTASELRKLIRLIGSITELPRLFDIDTVLDLEKLAQFYGETSELLPEQKKVVQFAHEAVGALKSRSLNSS